MTSSIEWSSTFDTGIEEIDLQHSQFVDLFNHFNVAQQDRHEVNRILDGLRDYVLYHFILEESLMEDAGYVFFRAHKKVHELIKKRLNEIYFRFKAGDDVTGRLGSLLNNMYNHIQHDDTDYVFVVRIHWDARPKNQSGSGWLVRLFHRFFSIIGVRF